MPLKFEILPTDALIYLLIVSTVAYLYWARRREEMRNAWQQICRNRLAIVSLIVLSVYLCLGFLDSIHFRLRVNHQYSPQMISALDYLAGPLASDQEMSYSAPFATHLFSKQVIQQPNGSVTRDYPKLQFSATHVRNYDEMIHDVMARSLKGFLIGALLSAGLFFLIAIIHALSRSQSLLLSLRQMITHKTVFPWRVFFLTTTVLFSAFTALWLLSGHYHVFGTNKVGTDVLYQAIKSIRIGLIIGTLTTLIMLPFALVLGISAGYFGGLIDDIIQYLYITLSSIPGVLLIAAAVLSLQIFIANHPDVFATLASRADIRLLSLCAILGVTSWTSLCRLLRAETLKLREIDFIQAAIALGSSHFKILRQHILPNVMHIIVITVVLDFSMLVLAEAVLSYVGVGVDPTTISWGNMINSARLELAREPVVWWPLCAAFIFMFVLVLSANLFSDAVRDAFDPRIRQQQ